MALSEQEELEYLRLKKRKALALAEAGQPKSLRAALDGLGADDPNAVRAQRSQDGPDLALGRSANPVSRLYAKTVGAPASRFFGEMAESNVTRQGNSLADRTARFAGAAGQHIAEDPINALVTEPLGGFYRAGRELMKPGGSPLTATAEAGGTALFFLPGAGPAVGTGKAVAARTIAKPTERAVARLTEADPNIAGAAQRAAAEQARGVPATTADYASRNAQSRLKGAARRDGPAQDLAQDAFDPRQAESASRLGGDIERAFGVEGDFLARKAAINEAKRTRSAPLYDKARRTPTRITSELSELLSRPPLQKALKDAEGLAAIDGVTLPPMKSGQMANTERLHYTRQALDEQIEALADPLTGKPTGVRAEKLTRLRKQFNEQIRAGNPAFKQADDIFSSGSRANEAMDRGVRAASFTSERQVRQFMQTVKPADKEFFDLGFAQGLVEKVGKGGSDMQNRTLKLLSPESQKTIRSVLGEDKGEELIKRVLVENLMTRTRNRISPNVGSDTAENVQQSAAQAVSLIAELARGNLVGAAARGAQAVGAKALGAKMIAEQRAVDEQLIKLATEGPQELLRLIAEVQKPKGGAVIPFRPTAGVGASVATEAAKKEDRPPR